MLKGILAMVVTLFLLGGLTIPAVAVSFTDVGDHWAARYIARMAAKGVITGYPGDLFKPANPVSRLEAVVMAVRVLGLEAAAKASPAPAIPSSFARPEAIPQWARGYVALGVQRGIIAGGDLIDFRPSDAARRHEVAVFLVRAMGLASQAQASQGATLDFIDAGAIPAGSRGYVAVAVQKGILTGFPEDRSLKPGDPVQRAQIAKMLAVVDDLLDNQLDQQGLKGTLVAASTSYPYTVMITPSAGSTRLLTLAGNTVIFREGKAVTVAALRPGDQVITVLNPAGEAVFIDAMAARPKVQGKITSLITGALPLITIQKSDNSLVSYTVSPSAVIRVDGSTATFAQLSVGQEVEVELDGLTVVTITATSSEREVVGVLYSVVMSTPVLLGVEDNDGKREIYRVSATAAVEKDGKTALLADLKPDDKVTVRLKGDLVVSVRAETMNKEVAGHLKALEFTPKPSLTIELANGSRETYGVSESVSVERNNRSAVLSDLRVGDKLSLVIRGGLVKEIDAESVDTEAEGTVRSVTIAEQSSITIRVEGGQDKTYPLARDVAVRKGSTRIQLSEVQVGYYVRLELQSGEVTRMNVEARQSLDMVSGEITYINLNAGIITLTTGASGSYQQVWAGSSVIVVKLGRVRSLSYLKEGDHVIAVGVQKAGVFEASAIVVTSTILE